MLIYKYRNEYVSNLKLKGYENMINVLEKQLFKGNYENFKINIDEILKSDKLKEINKYVFDNVKNIILDVSYDKKSYLEPLFDQDMLFLLGANFTSEQLEMEGLPESPRDFGREDTIETYKDMIKKSDDSTWKEFTKVDPILAYDTNSKFSLLYKDKTIKYRINECITLEYKFDFEIRALGDYKYEFKLAGETDIFNLMPIKLSNILIDVSTEYSSFYDNIIVEPVMNYATGEIHLGKFERATYEGINYRRELEIKFNGSRIIKSHIKEYRDF